QHTIFFYSSRRRHTRFSRDWSSDVCSSDLEAEKPLLVHVNSYKDLPTELEVERYQLTGMMTQEKLQQLQDSDSEGKMIKEFKKRSEERRVGKESRKRRGEKQRKEKKDRCRR